MPGTEQIHGRNRQNRLDEHFERAATHQAGVVLGIVIQIESEGSRLFLLHDFARCLPDLGFHATAANRAHDRTVIAHQHLRGLERRNGSPYVHDRSQRGAPALAAKLHDLFVDIHTKCADCDAVATAFVHHSSSEWAASLPTWYFEEFIPP